MFRSLLLLFISALLAFGQSQQASEKYSSVWIPKFVWNSLNQGLKEGSAKRGVTQQIISHEIHIHENGERIVSIFGDFMVSCGKENKPFHIILSEKSPLPAKEENVTDARKIIDLFSDVSTEKDLVKKIVSVGMGVCIYPRNQFVRLSILHDADGYLALTNAISSENFESLK